MFPVIEARVERSWQPSEPAPDGSPSSVSRAVIDGAERALPDGLQGSPVDLSLDEPELAGPDAPAFALARQRFPRAQALGAYPPSPAATHRITSPSEDVEVQRGEGPMRFAHEATEERGDLGCQRIDATARAGMGGFVGARPARWESGGQHAVPGRSRSQDPARQVRLAAFDASAHGTREHGRLRAHGEVGS